MTPYTAEFLGTFLLILLGNGVVANVVLQDTKGHNGGWIVITVGWAMGVFVGVFVAQDYSGAHINPAVTVSLAVAGKFAWSKVGGYILAQLLGAIAAASCVWLTYIHHYRRTQDPILKLATFSTIPQIRHVAANFFSEGIGTFVLLIAVLFLTPPNIAAGDPSLPVGLGSLGALPVSLVVLAIGLSLGGTTGYAINPARDLGPRIAHALLPIQDRGKSQWDYAWIPVLGPMVGGVLAALVYGWL